MIEGCDAGLILNNGTMENYFAEAYQPIYFVAANDLTETDTVRIRVGLIEGGGSSRPVNKGGEEKEAIITNPNKNKKEPEPLPMNPSTYCFPENFWTPHDLEGVSKVVVGDECDEEIVICENLESQILQESSFLQLRRNVDYLWVDENGNSHTSNTGDACLYEPPKVGRLDLGKSYVFEIIGNYSASTDPYYLLDDALIKACLDESDPNNPQWQFNIENLRIPVFADTCSLPSHYVDLIDGDITKIQDRVPHCDFYKGAVDVLKYFEKGPYYQPNVDPPYAIIFSAGVDAHENEHNNQTIREVIRYFSEAEVLRKIREKYRLPKNQTYSCPETAVAFVEDLIKEDLKNAILIGSDLYERMGFNTDYNEYKAELQADDAAKGTYTTIIHTFKTVGAYLNCQ